MKKIFALMTVMATLLLTGSCSKDEERDPAEVKQLITSTDWAGYLTEEMHINWGNKWENNNQQNYVVIHFDAAGKGQQVEFKTEFMKEQTGYSDFNWIIEDGKIVITYSAKDWNRCYIDYNDVTLDSKTFSGYLWDYTNKDYRFVMKLNAISHFDWNSIDKNMTQQ